MATDRRCVRNSPDLTTHPTFAPQLRLDCAMAVRPDDASAHDPVWQIALREPRGVATRTVPENAAASSDEALPDEGIVSQGPVDGACNRVARQANRAEMSPKVLGDI